MMNHPFTSWLLAGALAASLLFNLRGTPEAAPGDSGCGAGCGALVLESLGLSADQRGELERWKATACDSACRAEEGASAKLGELQAAMRDPATAPERLRELAAEVSRLRAEAIDGCVDSIVAVRRVLTPAQLRALMDRCCGQGACAQ